MTVSDAFGMQSGQHAMTDDRLGCFQQPGLLCELYHPQCAYAKTLFNPKTSICIQKRPIYDKKSNLGTPGVSEIALLLWGDVLKCGKYRGLCADSQALGIFCKTLSQRSTAASTAC